MSGVIFISLVLLCGVRDVHSDTNLAALSKKLNMLDRTLKAWKGTVVDLGTEMSYNVDFLESSLKEELTNTLIPALIKPLVLRIQELEDRDALREKQIQNLTEQIQKASSDPSHGERAEQMTTVTTHASSDPSQTARTAVTTTKKPATQATPSPAHCGDLSGASRRGNLEEVKRLLSRGVDVNCRWRGSRTPVMWAAYDGHRDVVELLVGEGADVSLVDVVGNNILHLACIGGDMETVKFLLSLHVVDIDARDKRGQTAADLARLMGHTRVADLLVSRGAQ
ncbi:putative ankyrin-containing lipoprotein Lxx09580 [Haliotis cracherodii]|uniref:putative ankyrin-containing lipoprotein Lxx09580 n=1 Tax=Haliotis cracherodii TaxID=6455 RepID=UPI0039EC5119